MEIQIDSAADQAILSALRMGKKRQAARLMVSYYGNAVYAVCTSMISNKIMAEDATQDSFSQAFKNLSSFQGEDTPREWLTMIAKQCCIGYQQKEGQDPAPENRLTSAAEPKEYVSRRMSESLQRRLEAVASAL